MQPAHRLMQLVLTEALSQLVSVVSFKKPFLRKKQGGKAQKPPAKHDGGSVMVLSCISASGNGNVVKTEGIIKTQKIANFNPPCNTI